MSQTGTFGPGADDQVEAVLTKHAGNGYVQTVAELVAMVPGNVSIDSALGQWMLAELVKADLWMARENKSDRSLSFYVGDQGIWPRRYVPGDVVNEAIQIAEDAGQSEEAERIRDQYSSPAADGSGAIEIHEALPLIENRPRFKPTDQVGDFEIVRKVGSGSFADVYLAHQRSIGRVVALKVSAGRDQETRTLARLDHPNIVRIFDRAVLEYPPVTLAYMQFYPGGNLLDVIAWRSAVRDGDSGGKVVLDCIDNQLIESSQSPTDGSADREFLSTASWPAVAAWMGIRLCRALSHAHQQGVLHRDVKPANVLLSSEGLPKLADFNVSDSDGESVAGSIAYMPPEVLRRLLRIQRDKSSSNAERKPIGERCDLADSRDRVDGRSDLYSLSVLLWELWKGYRPWDRESDLASERCSLSTPERDVDSSGHSGRETEHQNPIESQLALRKSALQWMDSESSKDSGAASQDSDEVSRERIFAGVLRKGLSLSPEDRFIDPEAMEAHLRLVLDPTAAQMFEPTPASARARLLRVPIALVASVALLVPHGLAAVANYQYNQREVMNNSALRADLDDASWVVNLVVLPVAVGLAVWYSRVIAAAITAVRQGRSADPSDVESTLDLGHVATLIAGTLWLSSGIAYPAILAWRSESFTGSHAAHLLASATGCGGLAIVYPYFAMTALAGGMYYPRYLMATLKDDRFDERRRRMRRRGNLYLIAAASLPMTVAAAMLACGSASMATTLVLLVAAIGFPFVMAAHVWTQRIWQHLDRWMAA